MIKEGDIVVLDEDYPYNDKAHKRIYGKKQYKVVEIREEKTTGRLMSGHICTLRELKTLHEERGHFIERFKLVNDPVNIISKKYNI